MQEVLQFMRKTLVGHRHGLLHNFVHRSHRIQAIEIMSETNAMHCFRVIKLDGIDQLRPKTRHSGARSRSMRTQSKAGRLAVAPLWYIPETRHRRRPSSHRV